MFFPWYNKSKTKLGSELSGDLTLDGSAYDGWYLVDGTVNISKLKITGDAHLILPDGAQLNSGCGVNVSDVSLLAKYVKARGQGVSIH